MHSAVQAGQRPFAGVLALWIHKEIAFGVVPQVMPLWISYSLYRFLLWEYIRGFYYAETAALLLIIIATVSLVDLGSAQIRKRFI